MVVEDGIPNPLPSIRLLHFRFHTARQLFNLLRFLDGIQRERARSLLDGLPQFGGELKQLLGIALDLLLALFVRRLHLFFLYVVPAPHWDPVPTRTADDGRWKVGVGVLAKDEAGHPQGNEKREGERKRHSWHYRASNARYCCSRNSCLASKTAAILNPFHPLENSSERRTSATLERSVTGMRVGSRGNTF